MNLEASHQLPVNNQPSASASGNSYWQAPEPQVTIVDRAAQAVTLTHKVATSKSVIVATAVLIVTAIAFASYVQVTNMRDRAYHAELQRTSRVVVL